MIPSIIVENARKGPNPLLLLPVLWNTRYSFDARESSSLYTIWSDISPFPPCRSVSSALILASRPVNCGRLIRTKPVALQRSVLRGERPQQ